MRKAFVACGVVVLLALTAVESAPAESAPAARNHPTGCKKVSFTGSGGYFSMGNFYPEPGDTVTITASWCYANGVITSHEATYTTDIPSSAQPRIEFSDVLNTSGGALRLDASGDYLSGALNNIGQILIVGHVTSTGSHHFRNMPSDGG